MATAFFRQGKDKPVAKPRFRLIFRAWRRDPITKEKLWARDYGKKAWPIWIPIED